MTGNIPGHSDAIRQKTLESKLDPMKSMLLDYHNLIRNELKENPRLDENRSFEFIVRNLGKSSSYSVPGSVMQLRSLKSEDLLLILDKIEKWVGEGGSATQLPLLPREIEAISQIVNAIEKKELVMKQGDAYISQEESEIYNAILQQNAVIEKAENLAKQRLIGVGKDGEVTIGNLGDNLEGIYDITQDNVDLESAFGGKGKAIFDDSEFEQESDVVSDEDRAKMKRGNYTDKFKKESEIIINKYIDLGSSLKQLYAKSVAQLEAEEREKGKKVQQGEEFGSGKRAADDLAKQNREDSKRMVEAYKTKQFSSKALRQMDRELDREARMERDARKKLSKDLDEKAARIKKEDETYDQRKEDIKKEDKEAA
jgi:hypothetical protein